MKHGAYMHQTHRQHNITVRDDTVSMCLGLSSPLMTEHEILSLCHQRIFVMKGRQDQEPEISLSIGTLLQIHCV